MKFKDTGPEPAVELTLEQLVNRMRLVAEQTYGLFFNSGMGTHVHAFLEFNGLIQEYVQICSKAASKGIDFRTWNVHTGGPGMSDIVEDYNVKYFAEKLGCIFAPLFSSRPELAQVFTDALFGVGKPKGMLTIELSEGDCSVTMDQESTSTDLVLCVNDPKEEDVTIVTLTGERVRELKKFVALLKVEPKLGSSNAGE